MATTQHSPDVNNKAHLSQSKAKKPRLTISPSSIRTRKSMDISTSNTDKSESDESYSEMDIAGDPSLRDILIEIKKSSEKCESNFATLIS